ncbi:MAG: ComEC/Rec2 family competence protein [Phyllobacteriaceae bacterium]|nr:ComEC/Rec2 family competence protein [Phyllobacteriaceae bacterium]
MGVREAEWRVDERLLTSTPAPDLVAPLPAPRPPARMPPRQWYGAVALVRAMPRKVGQALPAIAEALETERLRGGGFLLAPPFFGAGAYVYSVLAAEPGWIALLAAALALSMALWLAHGRPLARMLAALPLLVVAGLIAAKAESWRHSTPMLGSAVATQVSGRIVAIERQATGRLRITLDVLSTREPALRFAPQRIRVTAARLFPGAIPGVGIEGRVRLLPPSGPVRPGGYDFSWRAWFDGIGANGFFLGTPRPAAAAPAGWRASFTAGVEKLRTAMAERIRARVGGAEGEIAAALIVGVAAGVPEDLADAMRVSGLFHVLSISGLHMALVAGLVMGGLRLAFAMFPAFAERHAVKKFAAAAALGAAAFYLFLSGAGVATQRSFLMVAVMLAAVMADRAALTMRNLAIAALAILVWSPHEIAGPSFQMSFAATAALIAGWRVFSVWRAQPNTAPRQRGLARTLTGWIGAAVLGVAATSLLAGGATTLFSVWHFHRVAPLGLIANLAAMPVVSLVIMPSAVGATLAMPFGFDGPFLDAMGRGVATMNAIAVWTAARSPLDAVGMIPGLAVAVFSLGLVVVAAATTRLAWFGAPLLAGGAMLAFTGEAPDAFVSDDGRLVAVADGDALLVNRSRPNAFSLDEWQRAVNAARIVKPGVGGFSCDEGLCVHDSAGRPVVVHAEIGADAGAWCSRAALLVIADPTMKNPCRRGEATVVTRRTLARRGSAAVEFIATGEGWRAEIVHAVAEPFRPWHAHRAFSRAARGLSERKK